MKEIVFVTQNKGKVESAKEKLKNVDLKIFEYDLEEPRSEDIKYISEYKVRQAFNLVKKPCISLDCGFWIDELNGFPKAFVNFTLDSIGIDGILKLMEGKENRDCRFTECLSYFDGENLFQFDGKHEGFLSKEILGNETHKKWSDLWYIYTPKGYTKTLAQMSDAERGNRTRIDSISAIDEFSNWFIH